MPGVKLWGWEAVTRAWLRVLVDATGKLLVSDIGGQGLVYYGVVTAVPGANQFTIPTLAGLGAGKFDGATNPYVAFVFRDAGGASAAPQGELQTVTGYVTATGVFTTAAFTAAVAAGDEILILHPSIALAIETNTDVNALITGMGRTLYSMDFWSPSQEEVQLTAVAGDKALPTVTVADLPAGATVVRAYAMFKFRAVENTNAAANKLNGIQDIQIRTDAPGAWNDAINFVDDQFGVAATSREGGDVFIGSIDVAAVVTGNDGYEFQWDEGVADAANLQFNDVQMGIRLWYSV
jgi:hypothetical protein